jgi:hypothetical protein
MKSLSAAYAALLTALQQGKCHRRSVRCLETLTERLEARLGSLGGGSLDRDAGAGGSRGEGK